ncbi:MAG TPA: LamG domain-containing protein [Micromonosporaceae bacterium]|nr:LamG domain-containing protein [Micromonosporaceae bacterium]
MPSGEFEFESWAEPQWVQRGESWVDIDTTLTVSADGLVRPVASTADVVFSSGGAGPFATMAGAGATFSLAWPVALPQGVIEGDTITYPEVHPGVDLVVRAERGGFSHLLVVKTVEAAKNPAVRSAEYIVGGTAELTEADGGLTITGPDGMLAAAPPAVAWDSTPPSDDLTGAASASAGGVAPSSHEGPSDFAKVAPVEVRIGNKTLTIDADADLLDSGQYPVFIDPTYDKKWATWAPVNSSNPNTQWTSGTSWPRDAARVGSNWDNHSDLWRAHFRFDTSVLVGRRIVAADTSVDAYLVHTGHCVGESISIWQTNTIAGNTPTWNGMKDKWLHGGALQTLTGKANSQSCSQKANWLKYNGSQVAYHVQRHADAGHTTITFGLRMANESGGHWARFDPANVKLITTYQYKPHSPVAIRTAPGGNCNTTSPGPWINSRTPTLYGKASDGDGTVKVQFNLSGPTTPAIHTSANTNSGAERGWTTPTLTEGNYQWRVRGTDGVDETAWTGYCYFRLDHTGPTTPVVARTSSTPVEGQPVTLQLTSTDARSGVKQFAYGIGVDAMQSFITSTGSTTITFTPETGRTVVYVWAQDNAGNYSARTAYNFFTGRITEAQPEGAWRLDGDAFDDAGRDHDLTLGTGVGYGPDRNGRANSALTFDGTGCAETTPVIRTDAEFTISAWVKLNDKNGYRTVLQQVGSNGPSVSLHYTDADRWRLAVNDGATPEPLYTTLDSPTSPAVGVWQHLAGTVDPVTKVMRLYIDGLLVNERDISHPLWNAQSRFLIGCGGSASSTWNQMSGSIDHVGVWQGLLSDSQIARAATELPAGLVGEWQLRGDGSDSSSFGRDVVIPDGASWIDDQFGRAESAVQFNGPQCARSAGRVVNTDESFTIGAWVKLSDASTGNQAIIGQDGQRVSGWYLGTRYVEGVPYWGMMMMMADDETAATPFITSSNPITDDIGRWTHLLGVYDATENRMSLYINGLLAASAIRTGPSWLADGSLTIGCAMWAGVADDWVLGALSGVQVWRGALTATEVARVHGGNPGVKLEALWPLDGPASDEPTYLTDVSGNGHDLTIAGDYAWVRDRGYGRDGALGLELADNSCAETAGPVVRTDASFTVTAWVLLEETTGHHTVLSQAGGQTRGGIYLKYNPTYDRWHFGLPSTGDGTSTTWHTAESLQPPVLGKWTHLAGVYDVAAGKVRLYVDGVLQTEANGPPSPWMASGPTLIGCEGATDGRRFFPLGGVVDDVRIWTSTLDPDRIADLAAG